MSAQPTALQLRPPVNQIGHDPETDQVSPGLRAYQSGQRTVEKLIPVWHPKTHEKEMHTLSNARDLIRLNGWLERDPAAVEEVEAAAPTETEQARSDREAQSNADSISAHMRRLSEMRERLTRAGVQVDQRWGLKRLQEELARREVPDTAAVGAGPAEMPVITGPEQASA